MKITLEDKENWVKGVGLKAGRVYRDCSDTFFLVSKKYPSKYTLKDDALLIVNISYNEYPSFPLKDVYDEYFQEVQLNVKAYPVIKPKD